MNSFAADVFRLIGDSVLSKYTCETFGLNDTPVLMDEELVEFETDVMKLSFRGSRVDDEPVLTVEILLPFRVSITSNDPPLISSANSTLRFGLANDWHKNGRQPDAI
jgi:hypothetical protein